MNNVFFKVNKGYSIDQPLIEEVEKDLDEVHIADYSYVGKDGRTYTNNPKFTVFENKEDAMVELRTFLKTAKQKVIERKTKLLNDVRKAWNRMEAVDKQAAFVRKAYIDLAEMDGTTPEYMPKWVDTPPRPELDGPITDDKEHPEYLNYVARRNRLTQVRERLNRFAR